jgi:hypothetical protein
MRVLRLAVAATAFAFAGTGAFAESLDQDVTCEAVIKVMASPLPDQQKVKDILDFTLQTMEAVDRLHREKGQVGIFSQMCEEGRSSVALIVAQRCRSREGLTLADTAVETYEAIRTMRASLGLAGKDESKRSVPPAPSTRNAVPVSGVKTGFAKKYRDARLRPVDPLPRRTAPPAAPAFAGAWADTDRPRPSGFFEGVAGGS